jgi:hypothetical protein
VPGHAFIAVAEIEPVKRSILSTTVSYM